MAKLIGYTASDKASGPLGLISDYLPHPMNPVFVIQSEGKELLVPAVQDFIDQINSREKSIQFIFEISVFSVSSVAKGSLFLIFASLRDHVFSG